MALNPRIAAAKEAYYRGKPVMSDVEYDALVEGTDDPVGTECVDLNKVDLPIPMASLNKLKTEEELTKWLSGHSGVIAQAKYNGISALVWGPTGKVYVRGNGVKGTDVTEILRAVSHPAIKLLKDHPGIKARGEFLIPKSKFDRLGSTPVAYRNVVAGMLNTKLSSITQETRLVGSVVDLVLYSRYDIGPGVDFSELKHFSQVKISEVYEPDRLGSPSAVLELIDAIDYEADGVVFKSIPEFGVDAISQSTGKVKNPKHSVAFKPNELWPELTATVTKVEWNLTKSGRYAPRVCVNPIKTNDGAVTITHFSGKNANFMEQNGIGVGAVLLVKRGGDVIPDIIKSVTRAEHLSTPPGEYIKVGAHYFASSGVSAEKALVGVCEIFEIKGVGKKACEALVSSGVSVIGNKGIYLLSEAQIGAILGPAQTSKLAASLQTIRDTYHSSLETRVKVGCTTGFFTSQTTSFAYDRLFKAFKMVGSGTSLHAPKGSSIGSTLEELFNTGYPKFIEWSVRVFGAPLVVSLAGPADPVANEPEGTEDDNEAPTAQKPLEGKKVVLTNGKPKLMIDAIERLGGSLQLHTTKDTFLVVNIAPESESGNAAKAKKYGIEVITAQGFWDRYGR